MEQHPPEKKKKIKCHRSLVMENVIDFHTDGGNKTKQFKAMAFLVAYQL